MEDDLNGFPEDEQSILHKLIADMLLNAFKLVIVKVKELRAEIDSTNMRYKHILPSVLPFQIVSM